MSGVWEPAQSFQVTDEILAGYLELIANLDLENLSNGFPQDEMKSGAKLMKLQAKDWEAANALSDEQLTDLVRFFTKAEMDCREIKNSQDRKRPMEGLYSNMTMLWETRLKTSCIKSAASAS